MDRILYAAVIFSLELAGWNVATAAEAMSNSAAPNQQSKNGSWLVASNRAGPAGRNGKGKGKRRRKSQTDNASTGVDESRQPNKAVRRPLTILGNIGIINGTAVADSSPMFGADIAYRLNRNLGIVGGGLYWSATSDVGFFALSVSITLLDVGPVYYVPLGKSATLNLGARAGMALTSIDTTTSLSSGETTVSSSDSNFYGSITVGVSGYFDAFVVGIDLRKPFLSNEGISGSSSYFLVGSVGVSL